MNTGQIMMGRTDFLDGYSDVSKASAKVPSELATDSALDLDTAGVQQEASRLLLFYFLYSF
jgi:hypothetical protein